MSSIGCWRPAGAPVSSDEDPTADSDRDSEGRQGQGQRQGTKARSEIRNGRSCLRRDRRSLSLSGVLWASPMEIRLNGKAREVGDGITVRRLLDELGLHPQRVAVQRNLDIVKRDRYEDSILQPGDTVEILTIMAGG